MFFVSFTTIFLSILKTFCINSQGSEVSSFHDQSFNLETASNPVHPTLVTKKKVQECALSQPQLIL